VIPAARHPLYPLDMFTVIIPALDTKAHPSLIAAVRCLVGENFGVVLAQNVVFTVISFSRIQADPKLLEERGYKP
jgi:hypothetical protein